MPNFFKGVKSTKGLYQGSSGSTITALILGQSNERGAVWRKLTYASSSLVSDGSKLTFTTSVPNNLEEGSTYFGTITGAVPSSLNGVFKFIVAGGSYPNRTLTADSSVAATATTQGVLVLDVYSSYPSAFGSNKTSLRGNISPATTTNGGFVYRMVDAIKEETNIDVFPVNAAIGAMSFVSHGVGVPYAWIANYTNYYSGRPSSGGLDLGDTGSMMVKNDCLFQCINGGVNRYAIVSSGSIVDPAIGREQDGILLVNSVASPSSGATEPNWASVSTVGSTITDGTLTWKCVATGASAKGYANTVPFVEGQIGFDPLGLLRRAHYAGNSVAVNTNSADKLIIIQNGQAENSTTKLYYQQAMISIVDFFTTRGWKVAIGLSCYSPSTGTSVYDSLKSSIASVVGSYSSNTVTLGVDLYTLYGTTLGSNWLNLQSDRDHVSENLHLSALSAIHTGEVYAQWFCQKINTGFITI